MLLIVVMDVVQVFQQCYVVPMAVEAVCFSGRVISFPVLLEIVTRQKSCQRKLKWTPKSRPFFRCNKLILGEVESSVFRSSSLIKNRSYPSSS